jgi:hypothetical protein
MEALGVDVAPLGGRSTMFGFRNEGWKPWTLFDGTPVLVPGGFNTQPEPNGDLLMYPEDDRSAPPSGRMPKGGYYFDTIVRQEPIDEEKLDPADNLEEFGPISDGDLAHFAREAKRAAATGRGVAANFGGTAFGDIALVPAPFLKHPKGIRDIEEWYVSTVTRQEYIHRVFSRQAEVAVTNLEKIKAAVGGRVDAVFVCGTDLGTQQSQFCSVDSFRKLYFPYYKKVNDWVHANTKWKTFKHSCGAVEPLIEPFIEAGFDILNPVQCSAEGMEPAGLKARFGEQITFWGGGVDTQQLLPFGTPAQVRDHVRRQLEIFAPGGGYVFNTIHNVQPQVPVENLLALYQAVNDFR